MDWRHEAACLDEDPELFWPIGNTGPSILQIEEAKEVCRRCDVVETCLRWALDTGQDHGVWGALSEDERRTLKRRESRARTAAARVDLIPATEGVIVIRRTGLTNQEIANRTGIHKDTVSKIRRGITQWIEPGTLNRLEAVAAAVTA
jgi:WhiB family redox-sensing transcriptional regulator